MTAPKDFPQTVRDQAAERSKLLCEGCGGHGPLELHHRLYKSRGGRGTIENALALCGWGNHTGCHGVAHTAEGERRGWSIRSGFDPLDVPVLFPDGWHRLEGFTRVPVREADAIEYMVLIGARKEVTV